MAMKDELEILRDAITRIDGYTKEAEAKKQINPYAYAWAAGGIATVIELAQNEIARLKR